MNTFNRELKLYCVPEFVSFYKKCDVSQQTILEHAMIHNHDICNDMFIEVIKQIHSRGCNINKALHYYKSHHSRITELLPLLPDFDYVAEFGLFKIFDRHSDSDSDSDLCQYFMNKALSSVKLFIFSVPRVIKHNIITIKSNCIKEAIEESDRNYNSITCFMSNYVRELGHKVSKTPFGFALLIIEDEWPLLIKYYISLCLFHLMSHDVDACVELYNLLKKQLSTDEYIKYNICVIDQIVSNYT